MIALGRAVTLVQRGAASMKRINELFAADGDERRTILAGDMNARPDAEPIRILRERWTNAMDDAASPTVPVVNPTSRIDYIFYRSAADFRLRDARVIPELMASDHRPVFAELELAGA